MNPIEVSYYVTDIAIVTLYGEHDLATEGQLAETLRSLLQSEQRVIVDVSETEFVDSSVLTNLVEADRLAQKQGGRLTLQLGTAAIVRTALEVSGLLALLPCAPSREKAIQVARNGPVTDEVA